MNSTPNSSHKDNPEYKLEDVLKELDPNCQKDLNPELSAIDTQIKNLRDRKKILFTQLAAASTNESHKVRSKMDMVNMEIKKLEELRKKV